ncbi:hypothetical protein D8S78_13245 [Natrialba swarupiae]|nr:hypothetical protein [Natrialba swarupiae]
MTDSPIHDDRSTSEATPRRSTADRSSAETTSRRTALKSGIATVGALSLFGTGVSALETGSLEYNEDTELTDSAHSYQFSVTNTHDRTAIIQYLQLAELDYHTIALDNLDGDDTIEITPANGATRAGCPTPSRMEGTSCSSPRTAKRVSTPAKPRP